MNDVKNQREISQHLWYFFGAQNYIQAKEIEESVSKGEQLLILITSKTDWKYSFAFINKSFILTQFHVRSNSLKTQFISEGMCI